MTIDLYKTQNTCDWRKDSRSGKKYQFIYHFLPHPHENRRASLLSLKSLVYYCFIIVLITGLFRVIPILFPDILGYATNINVSDLLKDTNKIRSQSGLSDLTINSKLSVAAQKKAEHMFAHGYWAHVAPDGTEPWDFILGQNYDYIYAGENLAKNFSSSDDVVAAWFKSPSHRENLLNSNYSEVGYAVVNGKLNGYETTLVVQMFGKPRQATQMASVQAPPKAAQVKEVPVSPVVSESTLPVTATSGKPVPPPVEITTTEVFGSSHPLIDVRSASKGLTLLFSFFLATLLTLDIWYSKRMGIIKLTAHTWVHLSFLIIAIVGIWFVLSPGSIL